MKSLLKKSRLLGLALAGALAFQPVAGVLTANQAEAVTMIKEGYRTGYMVGAGGGGSSAGGIIVGGIFFSVASIIACAMIVGSEEGREMTLEEALLSGAIPLGCLFREHLDD